MCPAAMLARASVLLCLVVGSRQLSITELVVPRQLQAGEDAELQCRIDRGAEPEDLLIVKWWWTTTNTTDDKIQLYQRIGGTKPAPIGHNNIEIKDNDTIVLLKATPANSGVYECEVSSMSQSSVEVRKHEELTVFSPGNWPQVNISEVADGPDEDTEEDVLIQCSAEDVAPAPDIALKIEGVEVTMTETIVGPNAEGLYDVVGQVTKSKTDVDGSLISCELFYLDTNITHEPYIDSLLYYSSGVPSTTDLPENTTETDATSDSLQNPSDVSCACRMSWVLLLVLGLFTQVPFLL